MEKDALYQLALTRIPGIGAAHTKILLRHFDGAKSVFQANETVLQKTGIKPALIHAITHFSNWGRLEKELLQLEKKAVRLLFISSPGYPRRLLTIPDAPPLLFYKGNANLDAEKMVAVIGTRMPSEYGRQTTEQIIRHLTQPGLVILSGLAYGIDACAHKAALKYNIPTVALLGHGFGHIYPQENLGLAKSMLQDGGLLTSYGLHEGPTGFHFPARNKIVAGLCDALIVVETARKGGSLSTVDSAAGYGKKIFAVPGRLTDNRSSGCNWLLSQGKADVLISSDQLQSAMGWRWPAKQTGTQAQLPFSSGTPSLTAPEKAVMKLLTENSGLSFDELLTRISLSSPDLSMHLLNLELQGLVTPLPGRRYQLTGTSDTGSDA
ncbi:MAG: DNA-protecting protein DprA [Bacteroidetes bacterium]|nr:DNA-protecting protein DprA [Bacteroidota bacterium]